MIAANQVAYFNDIKDKVISFMSRIIMEQYNNCPMMDDNLKETALLMIYENLVDMTFKILKQILIALLGVFLLHIYKKKGAPIRPNFFV